ncbi:hypothetical protein FBU30_003983 [Linnemannia zychae]|nr:hypothetical protein FBU30_003983 [Linnemannia zychae]
MTGDEAYHADCFRCIQCASKIDDLVFAKTSQGIYCMKCHQERKEAKRLREERERMERAERMMEKLLPTIPETEKRIQESQSTTHLLPAAAYSQSTRNDFSHIDANVNSIAKDNPQQQQQRVYHQQQSHIQKQQQHLQKTTETSVINHSGPGMPKQSLTSPRLGSVPPTKPNKNISSPQNGNSLKTNIDIDMGPPFLPPLIFGLDDASTSSFDLRDVLGGADSETLDKSDSSSNPPTPPSKDAEIINSLAINSFRASLIKASLRLSLPPEISHHISSAAETPRSSTESHDMASRLRDKSLSEHQSDSIPPSSQGNVEVNNIALQEAEALIRELKMELAKFNPMSPLLHGTPQQEYGLLLEKTRKLSQEHSELEKLIRDMYIEKDMLGMDLEAMNNELKAKEEALASGADKLQPTQVPNPRLSTNHEIMKQAYLVEVKALQEQKERLQRDLQHYVEQRDGVLNEMQILSVRNAELSTMNNDMMRELQGRVDIKPAIAPSNNGMLQSFTDKIRRQRQMSGGNQSELRGGTLLGSGESTHSLTSTLSDDHSRGRSTNGPSSLKSRREDKGDDGFEDGAGTPKKFNWKKGTTNTVKSVGAMFGKLLVDGSNSNLEVPDAKLGQSLSDSGSVNSLLLPPTRTFSNSSETRSLNSGLAEQHSFSQHNFVRPTRCDACDDKLWGREYRCRNCAFHIHGRCISDILPACIRVARDSDSSSMQNVTPSAGSGYEVPPPPPAKQIMFGNDLQSQLELEQRSVPLVVEKCIEAVDKRGLEIEGIYRRSGMAAEARQLVQAYDIGMQPDLMDIDTYQDICSITSVLKQYLRSLPQPLIPYDQYAEFMEAISLPQNELKIQTFKGLLDRMPVAHYATLKALLNHLNRVTQRDKINLMNAKNLSVVFGPTLMRNPDPSREIIDMTFKNLTIEFLIIHTNDLFVQDSRPSTSSNSGSDAGRTSTSSNQRSPIISSSSSIGVVSNGSSANGWTISNGVPSHPHPTPPPRRIPNNLPQAGSQTSGMQGQPPVIPIRTALGEHIPNPANMLGQLHQPSNPMMPQSQPYQPVSQYRPQHNKQQQQQQNNKQQQQQPQQEQQQEQQQQEQDQEQKPPPPPPSSTIGQQTFMHPNYIPTPQQQQANPDVDMTHFP